MPSLRYRVRRLERMRPPKQRAACDGVRRVCGSCGRELIADDPTAFNDPWFARQQRGLVLELQSHEAAGRVRRCDACRALDLSTLDESAWLAIHRLLPPMLTMWALLVRPTHMALCYDCGMFQDWTPPTGIAAVIVVSADARVIADELARFGRHLIAAGEIAICSRCSAPTRGPVEPNDLLGIHRRYNALIALANAPQH